MQHGGALQRTRLKLGRYTHVSLAPKSCVSSEKRIEKRGTYLYTKKERKNKNVAEKIIWAVSNDPVSSVAGDVSVLFVLCHLTGRLPVFRFGYTLCPR